MAEFADLPEPLIIARGAAVFRPDAQYGIARQDLGEVDVSTTTDITYDERNSRKHLVRRLLSRTVNTRTDTVDITGYQKRDIIRFMKNLAPAQAYSQDADTDVAINFGAVGAKVPTGTVDSTGAVGIFNVVATVNNAAKVDGVDYIVNGPAGEIEWLKPQTGVRAITFDQMEYDGTETALGVLPEVRGHLDIYPVSEDDQEAVVRSFYIGVAPNGQINEITGDDGEIGWTFQGRQYSDPESPAFAGGREKTLPSQAALDAAIEAAAP